MEERRERWAGRQGAGRGWGRGGGGGVDSKLCRLDVPCARGRLRKPASPPRGEGNAGGLNRHCVASLPTLVGAARLLWPSLTWESLPVGAAAPAEKGILLCLVTHAVGSYIL